MMTALARAVMAVFFAAAAVTTASPAASAQVPAPAPADGDAAAAPAPPPDGETAAAVASPPEAHATVPPPEAPPPPPPVPPPAPAPPAPPAAAPARRYADAGASELSLALGYTQQAGFLGGGGYRRFVVDGVGPGVEGSVQSGNGLTVGQLLGSLRLVPFRNDAAALVLTGRAGRVLVSDHADGWGAGGSAGVIFFFTSSNIGLELSYEILWLFPRTFCADLSSCTLRGPAIGLRVAF